MNVRINQAGSVANFIIIGVVLVVLTAGVMYAVRQQDTPAPESTPVATEPEKKPATSKPDETPAPAETESATTPTPATAQPETVPAPTVTALSQTGPADTAVLQLVALGGLAITGASFLRSRKLRSSL